jgi:hypothetical protein
MKRWILYGILFALAVWMPVESVDIGKLHPVQAVSVGYQEGKVILKTDTGEMGIGDTPALALKNLQETAPAVIYLDTAEFLLMEESGLEFVTQMGMFLKDKVRVCLIDPEVEVSLAAKYLQIHGNLPKLKGWNSGGNLPILTLQNERIILLENL